MSPTRAHTLLSLAALANFQVEETGGPEKNVMREIPVPQPKEGEVLLKVEWTGANYIDNCECAASYTLHLLVLYYTGRAIFVQHNVS